MLYSSLVLLGLAATGYATPLSFRQKSRPGVKNSCPPISGDFNVTNFKLYSENSDFDSVHCKYYIGANFNATVLVYDPYTQAQTTLTFPGISHTSPYHISGIDFDARTSFVYFMANSDRPYLTNGQDQTGPNHLIKYDTKTNTTVYTADLNTYTAAIQNKTGKLIGGFQDMAEDTKGNSYAIASYGNGIAKVSPSGVVSEYYTPATFNVSASGINGISSFGDKLLVVDNIPAAIYTFDTTATKAVKTPVALTQLEGSSPIGCDGVYMPPMFDHTIMLCSEDGTGITVYRSLDGWKTAKELGLVKNKAAYAAETAFATNSVQIGNSIYTNEEYFFDTGVFEVPGNRTSFPFVDITSQVLALVNA